MSGGEQTRRETIAAFIERAFEALPTLDYYRVLGVGREATVDDLKAAYYRLAAQLHPDLHIGMRADGRRKLTAVYSRVVEAYRTLSHGERRLQYDRGLAEGKLRWDADAAAHQKIKRKEDDVPDGAARKFFKLGCAALNAQDGKAAVMNLRIALSMAPGNAVIEAELSRAEALAGERGGGS